MLYVLAAKAENYVSKGRASVWGLANMCVEMAGKLRAYHAAVQQLTYPDSDAFAVKACNGRVTVMSVNT